MVLTLKIAQARAIYEIFRDLSNFVRSSDREELGIAIDIFNKNTFDLIKIIFSSSLSGIFLLQFWHNLKFFGQKQFQIVLYLF